MLIFLLFFFFKQKTAYEMRISDWSSDVCSSDLKIAAVDQHGTTEILLDHRPQDEADEDRRELEAQQTQDIADQPEQQDDADIEGAGANAVDADADQANDGRSEERRGGKESVSTCRSRWAPIQ